MNKTLILATVLISLMLAFIFYALENDRKSLSGTYYGNKCRYFRGEAGYEKFIFDRLELNKDSTFKFSSLNNTYTIKGEWKQAGNNTLLFKSKQLKDKATFHRHNIHFTYNPSIEENNQSLNIDKVHRCNTYNGSEKRWWESIFGVLAIILFLITCSMSIMLFLVKIISKIRSNNI